MSSSLLVLVCLLICLGAASAATVTWYPSSGCGGTATTSNSVSVANTGAASSCFAVGSTLAGATASCASSGGVSTGVIQLYSSTTCSGTGNAVAVFASGADGSACVQVAGTVPTSISYAKLNCNSAFTANSISLALVVLLALLAMIAM